jgi:membrane protein involved in colicin uptake
MRDPEKAQRLMKERIVKLDSEIEVVKKRAEEERLIAVEAKKNEAIERKKAEDEMKMRLMAEAKAEALQKELAEMRAKANAMSVPQL